MAVTIVDSRDIPYDWEKANLESSLHIEEDREAKISSGSVETGLSKLSIVSEGMAGALGASGGGVS